MQGVVPGTVPIIHLYSEDKESNVDAASSGQQISATSFDSAITEHPANPPDPEPQSPGEAATAAGDELCKWLSSKLKHEREDVLRLLKDRHCRLVDECQRHFDDEFLSKFQGAREGSASAGCSSCATTNLMGASKTSKSISWTPTGMNARRSRHTRLLGRETRLCNADGMKAMKATCTRLCNVDGTPKSHLEDQQWSSVTIGDPPEQSVLGTLKECVKSQQFEFCFAGVILMNAAVMAAQLQYDGSNHGNDLGVRNYDVRADEYWPEAEDVFAVLEIIFAVIFTIELLLRLLAHRLSWFRFFWSYVDAMVVLCAWATTMSAFNLSVLRLARVGKLVRIIRLMRSTQRLESLQLLVASIAASFQTLFWSLCVLFVVQSFAALIMSQLLESYIEDPTEPLDKRREVFNYFGTFWRSTVTMFEITFANWAPSCRLLTDHVNELYGAFYVIYRCVIGFAVLLVIQAVFIQQTMKSAEQTDDVVVRQKEREKKKYADRLKSLFSSVDVSGDGYISYEEFMQASQGKNLRLLLSTLEVDVHDLEVLFKLLDDGDGEISLDEFVTGVTRLRGTAKEVDLLTVLSITRRVDARIRRMEENIMSGETNFPAFRPHTSLHQSQIS